MLDFAFSAVSLVAVAAWLMLALACAVRIGAARRRVLFVAGRGAPIFLSAVYRARKNAGRLDALPGL